ncbi:NAD(P)H-binding protein [Umezawaea sp. Da 62-37]|uniref:NAD(P)-dependent oxidoreductase n=1 Tax=Umezawaea sp. Da 62-37 TaxID=3075927 RepID=UPI0028F6FB74|nr:NAD(P)H-binding protein [Umezawaea sp. Da 62-37]WNV86922.1 NAD(P)H-binding protein [Umezawaea sp. Da 62-37]
MSKVVVFGAAGRTGRLVVEEALGAGHHVTAAVRTPSEFPAAVAVARADVRDPDSVCAAVAGHDVVVSAIGPAGRRPLGLYSEGAVALRAAMESTGVGRIIAITSGGVRRDDPNFGFWYRAVLLPLADDLYADMRLLESTFRESALDWTFVRPAHLQDKPPTGTFRVRDGGTPEGGWKVTRTDVARFITHELDAHRWSKAAPTLAQ